MQTSQGHMLQDIDSRSKYKDESSSSDYIYETESGSLTGLAATTTRMDQIRLKLADRLGDSIRRTSNRNNCHAKNLQSQLISLISQGLVIIVI